MIRLLVGLGNPGPEYEATRHNAGFWFIDKATSKLGVSLQPDRSYFGLVGRAGGAEGPIWLLKPMTFMNLSGRAVAALSRFYKIAAAEILVIHDELDLLPGQVKLKRGGSHAGHNGLKDIQAQLGTADFWRLRLGIGHPGLRTEVVDYVLRKPPPIERNAIDANIEQALSALDLLLGGAMEQALTQIHAKPPRAKATPARQLRPSLDLPQDDPQQPSGQHQLPRNAPVDTTTAKDSRKQGAKQDPGKQGSRE